MMHEHQKPGLEKMVSVAGSVHILNQGNGLYA